MKHLKVTILVITLLSLSTLAQAQSTIRLGSAGAQELLLPIGARGYALGGAMVADVTGVEATFWNPAGVSLQAGTEVMFSHLPYFAGIDINFFGVSTELTDIGNFAITAKVVDIGEIEETTETQPEGTGAIFNPTLSVIGLTFSRQMTHQVSFGVTANYINEKIFEVSANSVSFDFGMMFDPRWEGVTLGFAIKNIGPDIRFTGRGFDLSSSTLGPRQVRSRNAAAELPSHVVMGLSYRPYMEGLHSIGVSGNFQSNNFSEDLWIGGLEYSYDEKYFLRGAYNYSQQNDYALGLSFGGGLVLDLEDTRVTIEAAWRETEFFDNEVVFTGKINF